MFVAGSLCNYNLEAKLRDSGVEGPTSFLHFSFVDSGTKHISQILGNFPSICSSFRLRESEATYKIHPRQFVQQIENKSTQKKINSHFLEFCCC